jgi:hypothetical protein
MARRAVNPIVVEEDVLDDLVEAVASHADDPLGFVLFAFPWGEEGTDLADETGPDKWQWELLEELGRQVRERRENPELPAIQIAVASGHGVGKSTLLCWVLLWFMSCHMDPTVTVTANTLGQLTGKTWRELAKWHRRMIHADWFQWTATQFYLKEAPGTHKADAVPWTKERSEAFQGAHAKHILTIFDEGSAIDDSIWVATDGAMTTRGAIWLVFGNPTRNDGRFRECFRRFRHRWTVRQVDSRTAKMANRAQIQGWIDDYGEDSDFVRVRVKGEFPRSSSTQLIGSDLVEAARAEWKRRMPEALIKRALAAGPWAFSQLKLETNPTAPKLLMVDVARFGDDQTVIGMRHGRVFVPLGKYRNLDVVQVAHRTAEWIEALAPRATFIDANGIGAGVYDILRDAGHEVIAVNSAIRAMDERRYFNRRMEMWWLMRDWLRDGGVIPHDDQELADDLTGPLYSFASKDRVQLETKDDMRARGMASPDTADCLALSFAQAIAPALAGDRETVATKLAAWMEGYGAAVEGETWQSR